MATRGIPDTDSSSTAAATRRLTPRDLEWLRCPVCRSSLAMIETEAVPSPELRCSGCGRTFPIVDDLPVLLADRVIRYI